MISQNFSKCDSFEKLSTRGSVLDIHEYFILSFCSSKWMYSKYRIRDENRIKNIIRKYQILNHMKVMIINQGAYVSYIYICRSIVHSFWKISIFYVRIFFFLWPLMRQPLSYFILRIFLPTLTPFSQSYIGLVFFGFTSIAKTIYFL